MFKNSCDQKTNLLKPHEFLHILVRSALAPSPSQQALLLTLGMSVWLSSGIRCQKQPKKKTSKATTICLWNLSQCCVSASTIWSIWDSAADSHWIALHSDSSVRSQNVWGVRSRLRVKNARRGSMAGWRLDPGQDFVAERLKGHSWARNFPNFFTICVFTSFHVQVYVQVTKSNKVQ